MGEAIRRRREPRAARLGGPFMSLSLFALAPPGSADLHRRHAGPTGAAGTGTLAAPAAPAFEPDARSRSDAGVQDGCLRLVSTGRQSSVTGMLTRHARKRSPPSPTPANT